MRHLSQLPKFLAVQGADPWASVRRAPRHNDEALTGTCHQWLRKLPAGRRPTQLCMLFPRLANQIAWHWPDRAGAQALIDELLVDHRGGRTGFPKAVTQELRRLRDFTGRPGEDAETPGYRQLLQRLWPKH